MSMRWITITTKHKAHTGWQGNCVCVWERERERERERDRQRLTFHWLSYWNLMAWLQNVFCNFVCNILSFIPVVLSFPDGSESIWGGKESTCQCRRRVFYPLVGWQSPGEGDGNPLQYSCLGNPMDRGARRAIVRGVTKSLTRLNDWAHNSGPDSHLAVVKNRDHKIVICTILNTLNCLSSKRSDLLAGCSTISKIPKSEGQLWP